MQTIFGFPESATGLFVTGTSMANLIGVLIARDVALGFETRCAGVAASPRRLTAYASSAVHTCVARAMDFAGLGSDALRLIPARPGRGMDLAELETAIEADRRAGFTPFLVVGTAGSVDTGAIDDLSALADLSRREHLWFHVDGACGALAVLAPDLAPRLSGIERADSLAFDFHKWGQAPYDAGFILVRDGVLHRKTFATSAAYLRREETRTGRRLAVALRFRTRSFPRISRAEDMVHAEGLWRRRAGTRRSRALADWRAISKAASGKHLNWNCWRPWN